MPPQGLHPDRLTHASIAAASAPCRMGDGRGGNGLSVLIKPRAHRKTFSKTFSQRLRVRGKTIEIGLGAFPAVTLAMARQKALENRLRADRGEDPRRPTTSAPTLDEAMSAYVTRNAPTWKGSQTVGNWDRARRACAPIGSIPIKALTPYDILTFLETIAVKNRYNAHDIRSKIATALDYYVVRGELTVNPAPPAISKSLPSKPPTQHHKRLHHTQLSDAIALIRDHPAWWAAKLGLIFLLLTCTRSANVRRATWDQIDFETSTWHIPADHMKGIKAHDVPLSTHAIEILLFAESMTGGTGLIFPAQITTNPMGSGRFSEITKRLGLDTVPHGLRSSFRNWAGEDPFVARPVAEKVLAHITPGVEGSYLNDDFFQPRSPLMQQWAEFLIGPIGHIIPPQLLSDFPTSETTPKPTAKSKQAGIPAATRKNVSGPTTHRSVAQPPEKAKAQKTILTPEERRRNRTQSTSAYKRRLKNAGLCLDCTEHPARPGRTRCQSCADKKQLEDRARRAR